MVVDVKVSDVTPWHWLDVGVGDTLPLAENLKLDKERYHGLSWRRLPTKREGGAYIHAATGQLVDHPTHLPYRYRSSIGAIHIPSTSSQVEGIRLISVGGSKQPPLAQYPAAYKSVFLPFGDMRTSDIEFGNIHHWIDNEPKWKHQTSGHKGAPLLIEPRHSTATTIWRNRLVVISGISNLPI
jgi:hypothetical protein